MSEFTKLQMIRQIGKGRFGKVFLFENAVRQKQAVKYMRYNKDNNINYEEFLIQSDKEFLIQKDLNHENIVKLFYKTTTTDGAYVIVMEYVEFSLHKIINYRMIYVMPFCEGEIKGYLKQMLLGIKFCHDNNVLHCDISPQNILLNKNGILKLADFGLATKKIGMKRKTAVTLWYRAPELLLYNIDNPFNREVPFTESLDIWAIGCITLEIIYLSPVLQGENENEMLLQINNLCGSPKNREKNGWVTPFCRQIPHTTKKMIRICFNYLTSEFINTLENILQIEWYLRPSAKTLLERDPIYSNKCEITPFDQNQIAEKLSKLKICSL